MGPPDGPTGPDPMSPPTPSTLTLEVLAGRLCELSGQGATCLTSYALTLVRQAHARGELAAWLLVRPRPGRASASASPFLAEDLLALGLDLDAFPLVLARDLAELGRAATHLLRSGAFALVVLDLLDLDAEPPAPPASSSRRPRAEPRVPTESPPELPLPLMSRLHGLAQRHGAAVLALTTRPANAPSLGSLVSWHGHLARSTTRLDHPDGHPRLVATLTALKDKRRGPGQVATAAFRAPPGLP